MVVRALRRIIFSHGVSLRGWHSPVETHQKSVSCISVSARPSRPVFLACERDAISATREVGGGSAPRLGKGRRQPPRFWWVLGCRDMVGSSEHRIRKNVLHSSFPLVDKSDALAPSHKQESEPPTLQRPENWVGEEHRRVRTCIPYV